MESEDDAEGAEEPPLVPRVWLKPPRTRADAVPRQGLVDRLIRGEETIAVVSGPSGSGKSVLLTQTYSAADQGAWLSVTSAHNDPVVLWWSLIEALGTAIAGFGSGYRRRLLTAGPVIVDDVASSVLQEIADQDRVVHLFIDDVHLLDNEQAAASVGYLLLHLSANARVVVATRDSSRLPMARLRAGGLAVELGAADLTMSIDEVHQMLDGLGAAVDRSAVETLVGRTEGWPAGIQLARMALEQSDDAARVLDEFEGTERLVTDYFTSEVLETLPPRARTFLIETSFLPRLTGDLCAAVTGLDDGHETLAELERVNAFVVPIDRAGHWYRYHHLFANLLRAELRRTHTEDEVRELEARAFYWFRDRGLIEESVELGIEAGLDAEAGDLVAAGWWDMCNSGRVETVQRWLKQFGPERIERHQPLAVAATTVSALVGERAAAARFIRAAAQGSYEGPPPDGTASMESAVALARGVVALDGLERALADGELVLELEPPSSPWRPLAALVVGLARTMLGDRPGAVAQFAEARDCDDHMVSTYATAELSLSRLALGDVPSALRLAADACAQVHRSGLEDLIMAGGAAAALAHACIAVDDSDRALQALKTAAHPMDLLGGGMPMDAMHIHMLLARAALELDEPVIARQHVCDAEEIGSAISDTGPMGAEIGAIRAHLDEVARAQALPDPESICLTEREQEILLLLPSPLTTREVGAEFYLSANTIKTYQRRIYRKLNVSSRTEAVEVASALDLLEPAVDESAGPPGAVDSGAPVSPG